MKRISPSHPLRGNILPLALVIMTAILLAGMGLGTVVLDGLRRTADTDASMVAYYAADAGIERQLYDLRKLSSAVSTLGNLQETFASNQAKWDAEDSDYLNSTFKLFPVIEEGDFQFVDLFNPDAVNVAAGVGRVDWTWGQGGDCGGIDPEVEMSYAQWLAGADVLPQEFIVTPPDPTTSRTYYLDPSKGYRLRFRPKGCSALNLKVEVSPTAAYAPMEFPGDITLGSTGSYRKTMQSISVQAPRQEILSGVFSYVIFSECTLFKDPTNPSPPICP